MEGLGVSDGEQDMTENALRTATFWALAIVVLTTVFAATMNWLTFEQRKQMFAQMAELARRVEAVERRTNTQTQPPQRQQKYQER